VTVISLFEVPPGNDEEFIAAWDRVGAAGATLHRAWRPDVAFRFVAVGSEGPRGDVPFPSHSSACELVHEDGLPDGAQGVVVVDPFEVPADADDRFLAGWYGARDVLARQRGYLGTRLYRSTDAQARFRWAEVARWSSPLMYSKALHHPEFEAAAAAVAHPSHPALYQVIRG
jgi:heme-degrading monooxygenase HmoA